MRWSRCPICKSEIKADSRGEHFPFCSERCQMVDLGRWLVGDYKIPTDEPASGDDLE